MRFIFVRWKTRELYLWICHYHNNGHLAVSLVSWHAVEVVFGVYINVVLSSCIVLVISSFNVTLRCRRKKFATFGRKPLSRSVYRYDYYYSLYYMHMVP